MYNRQSPLPSLKSLHIICPRYFTLSDSGITLPFTMKEGHTACFKALFLHTKTVLFLELYITSKIPVRWPGQCYGFTLSLIFKYFKEDKETWWWDEEVQESIRKKILAKKRWYIQRDEESKQEYKEMGREAKKEVAKAKSNAYDELYEGLDTKEGEKTLYRLARQRHQAGKDVQQVRMMKDKDGNVMTDEESVLRMWKEYYMGLMN